MKEYFNATAKVAEKYVKQPAISDTRLIWCLGNKADTNTSIAYRVKIAPALHSYMKLGLKEYRYSNKLVWIPSLSVTSKAIKVLHVKTILLPHHHQWIYHYQNTITNYGMTRLISTKNIMTI